MAITQNPNYSSDNEAFLAEEKLNREFEFAEASKLIQTNLKIAAAKVVSIFQSSEPIIDTTGERLKFDAAKHVLKLGGLEVERSEVKGSGLKLVISPEHAAKVMDAAQ